MTRFRRSAWLVLAAISMLAMVFGLGDVLLGAAFEPTTAPAVTGRTLEQLRAESPASWELIDAVARAGGATFLAFFSMVTIVASVPYRAGQRWAWFAMWVLPAWAVATLVLGLAAGVEAGQPPPAPLTSAPVFAVIAAAALLVDWGRFGLAAATTTPATGAAVAASR